jgi:hypothetical protein
MLELTDHPYDIEFRRQMDSFHENLWANPELAPSLNDAVADSMIAYLLELACQCQNIRNITLGRTALWALPNQWLLEKIEPIAEPLLQLNDEWEYRRLLEIYWRLDKSLVKKLALRSLDNPNPEIREAGQECLDKLADPIIRQRLNYWE